MNSLTIRMATTVAALLFFPAITGGQPAPVPFRTEPYVQPDRGTFRGPVGLGTETFTAVREVVRAPGAPWIRLRFGGYHLGARSFITVTSLQDGATQRLNAGTLAQWKNTTALFNGDAAEVQ